MRQEGHKPAQNFARLFQTNSPLILASGSPRRKQFLLDLGIDFTVQTTDTPEQIGKNESPDYFVKRVSQDKAQAVAQNNKSSWVLGADTVVVFNNLILGKPADRTEALEILNMLNGKSHEVWTGFAICNESKSVRIQRAVKTEVLFFQSPKELLLGYISTGEPFDKAGGYGIQGKGGVLVKTISGSYSNVVGLPLAEVVHCLITLGVIQPLAW